MKITYLTRAEHVAEKLANQAPCVCGHTLGQHSFARGCCLAVWQRMGHACACAEYQKALGSSEGRRAQRAIQSLGRAGQ